ncbi:MAG: RNA polymerase sigma factor [Polyangia bacterium]
MTLDPCGATELAPSIWSDQQVIDRVLAGNTAVFEILLRRYNQRLFRIVRAITRDDAEAEDATQQAYLSAYANLAQYVGRSSFATWLTRIAINEALSRTQRRVRLAEVELEEHSGMKPLASRAPSPEDHVATRETRALLEAAIDRLPENYRTVFVMREVQQLNLAETSACLEITEDNVKVRLHRAKALLRDVLYETIEHAAGDAFLFLGARCDRIVQRVLGSITRTAVQGDKDVHT